MLPSDAGYHSAKALADALNGHRKRRDHIEEVSERSVQRWMAVDPIPPEDNAFNLILRFFRDKDVLGSNLEDPKAFQFVAAYHQLKETSSKRRKLPHLKSKLNIQPSTDVSLTDLAQIMTAKTPEEIGDVLASFNHVKGTTFAVSKLVELGTPYDNHQRQEMIATLVLDCGNSEVQRNVASICANVLAKINNWKPSELIISRITQYHQVKLSKEYP